MNISMIQSMFLHRNSLKKSSEKSIISPIFIIPGIFLAPIIFDSLLFLESLVGSFTVKSG